MSETERLLLKCIDGLASMVTVLTVAVDSEMGGVDGDAYYLAYGKYSAARYELTHRREDDEGESE